MRARGLVFPRGHCERDGDRALLEGAVVVLVVAAAGGVAALRDGAAGLLSLRTRSKCASRILYLICAYLCFRRQYAHREPCTLQL